MITSKVYRVVRYFDDCPENTMCKCGTIEEARIKMYEHNNREMSKSGKLEYIRSVAYKNERVTNWHLSDDLRIFIDKFYDKNIKLIVARKHFTRYANMLVKEGYLTPASRIPLGFGSWSDYHTRTQTVWNLSGDIKRIKNN